MGDLGQEMDRLRKSFASTWSDTRQKSVEKALLRRQEREGRSPPVLRVALIAAAAALVVCLVFWRAILLRPSSPERQAATPAPAILVLSDGSSVTPGAGADVRWAEVGPARVTAVVRKGRANFDVFHADTRVFRVEAGAIAVQALGTSFDVERTDEAHCRVTVLRGKVRVFWPGGSSDVAAGKSGAFPPEGYAAQAAGPLENAPSSGPEAVAELPSPPSPLASSPPLPTPPSWRNLAETGAFEEAYESLAREGGSRALRGSVSDLLLASDVARLSHHPADAVDPLQRILLQHAEDPRASLAAFTLGRVHLESLGQPHEAAVAFAKCRALAPGGELASDALAREVEARATAGDTDGARALAEEYARDYPEGARLRSVKRYGGIE